MAFSPSGSSKRARSAIINATQVAVCIVDGCTTDLSNCRKYHQRHKVCEVHSKTPQVSINGKTLRFCQQCSRFHSPEEFDEKKRSCRKRLDGHNRRRRKPQSNLFYGPDILQCQYVGPQVHPTTALASYEPYDPPQVQFDYSDSAHSLLSTSSSQTSGTTLSHLVHPSASSFSTTTSRLEPRPAYGGLENEFEGGCNSLVDMRPCDNVYCDHEDTPMLPFYWQ